MTEMVVSITKLSLLFLFFQITFCGSDKDWIWNRRIGGGSEAEPLPFVVTLNDVNGGLICGGSLIGADTVITAAHCIENKEPHDVLIHYGSNNLEGRHTTSVKGMVIHGGYHGAFTDPDIAIIFVHPIPSDQAQSIEMQSQPWSGDYWAAGFGSTAFKAENGPHPKLAPSYLLRKAQLKPLTQEECIRESHNRFYLGEGQICVQGDFQGICPGDSGGPLYYQEGDKYVLAGISALNKGCGDKDPSGYTKVMHMAQWIKYLIDNKNKYIGPKKFIMGV